MLYSINLKILLSIFLSIFLFACAKNTISEESSLKQDAKIFCSLYEEENLRKISPSNSIDDADEIIFHRGLQTLKTDEFKTLMKEMRSIQFYRQMYPFTKSKIEKIIGESWDCQACKKFYHITLKNKNSDIGSNSGISKNIIITKNGDYLIQDNSVELTVEAINAALDVSEKEIPHYQLDIILKKDTSDEFLEPLFKVLASLGFKKVNVLNEE